MAFFVSASLAACASAPAGSGGGGIAPREPSPPLPPPLQGLFDRVSAETTPLASSPWGREVVVRLGVTYPAASGRECRTFVVQTGDGAQPGLACRRADRQWAEVRILHHDGRPVLGDRS